MADEEDIGFCDADSATDEDEIIERLPQWEVDHVLDRRVVSGRVGYYVVFIFISHFCSISRPYLYFIHTNQLSCFYILNTVTASDSIHWIRP